MLRASRVLSNTRIADPSRAVRRRPYDRPRASVLSFGTQGPPGLRPLRPPTRETGLEQTLSRPQNLAACLKRRCSYYSSYYWSRRHQWPQRS